MKKYFPYFILAALFLLLKVTNLGIKLSDTNIYFYTGYQLLQGKILYRDIFFTNFPLLPYISSLYYLLTFHSLPLFYFTAAIEAAATGCLIYHIILKQTKNALLSALSATLYLFSFMLLSTTDHQTGVFLASLFAVLSYYFWIEKKLLPSGIFVALALLTKAYFLPIFLTYLVMLFWKESGEGEPHKKTVIPHLMRDPFSWIPGQARNDIVRFFTGFLVTIFLILLPSLLFAPHDLFRDVFAYSLTRSEGVAKTNLAWFFFTHDLPVFLLLIANLLFIKKHRFFGLFSIFSILFFLLYKDIYYLYLNFALPFLCLSLPNALTYLEKKFSLQKSIAATVIAIFLLITLVIYLQSYRDVGKIENLDALTQAIQQSHATSLYGTNDITPALAYLTNTKMLDGIVDTNTNIFRKGFLNASTLTKDAIAQHALFITHGAVYPQYNVNQPVTDEIFDTKEMKNCTLIQSVPIHSEGVENRLNLIACK